MTTELSWSELVKQHEQMISDDSFNNWLFLYFMLFRRRICPCDSEKKIVIEFSEEEVEILNFIDDYICNAALYASIEGDPDRYMLSKSTNLIDKILSSIGK